MMRLLEEYTVECRESKSAEDILYISNVVTNYICGLKYRCFDCVYYLNDEIEFHLKKTSPRFSYRIGKNYLMIRQDRHFLFTKYYMIIEVCDKNLLDISMQFYAYDVDKCEEITSIVTFAYIEC